MVNIDVIMDMLDWNNPQETQEKGRELAREVRCINVFLQPGHQGHSKNVWDNCAQILSEKTDQQLQPYLYNLFKWLLDMNWPGAQYIYDRLVKYERNNLYNYVLEECINEAKVMNEDVWLSTLLELLQ